MVSPAPGSSEDRLTVPGSSRLTTWIVTVVDALTFTSYVYFVSKSGLTFCARLISPVDGLIVKFVASVPESE